MRSRPARRRSATKTWRAPSTTPKQAKSIEPWAASPYVQLGLLAELRGEYPLAVSRFSDAIEREDHNWQLYYLRSRAKGAAGDTAGASADLEEARRLNPRAPELTSGAP